MSILLKLLGMVTGLWEMVKTKFSESPVSDKAKTSYESMKKVLFGRKDLQANSGMRYDELDELEEEETLKKSTKHVYVGPLGKCARFLPWNITRRYFVAWMSSMGFMVSFGIRCNISYAMVEMMSDDGITNRTMNYTRPMFIHTITRPSFTWSLGVKSLVDGSFFFGYLITQIPGGIIANKFSATRVFGFAVCSTSALNLLLPGAIKAHYSLVMIVKIMQGLVEVRTLFVDLALCLLRFGRVTLS